MIEEKTRIQLVYGGVIAISDLAMSKSADAGIVPEHDCRGYDPRHIQAPEQDIVRGFCYGPLDENGDCPKHPPRK